MSRVVPAGIDFGNLITVSSVFKVNQDNPTNSSVVIVADRNGKKEPSSQVFFDQGNRFSGTAASLRSDKNPANCIQFIKSSIKRTYNSVNDDIKKIVKSMKEDKDGNVEFVLTIDSDEKHFWPSHLSGVYLADRIEDIRSFSEDHEAKLNTVISVPLYYTREQVADFEGGLNVADIHHYILISEVDAVAVEYGYFKNLHHEFDETPLTALFVGVGFSEAQAFIIHYTKDEYEIVAYEHTNKVNSNMLDSMIIKLSCDSFDETSDPEYDGVFNKEGFAYFHNFNDFLKAKTQFSNPDNEYAEINLHHYNDDNDEFAIEVYSERLNEMIDESGILECLQVIIRSCIETCMKKNLTIDRLELCDDGVRAIRFRETVNSVLSEFDINISFLLEMNTRRVISECISRGCAEYAFYSAYVTNPEVSSVLSGLCESVTPISCTSPYYKLETKIGQTINPDTERMIMEAKNVENQMKLLKEEAKRIEIARNDFQLAIKELKDRIYDKRVAESENYYLMNEFELLGIIKDFNDEYDKKENATAARMQELKTQFCNTVEERMTLFIKDFQEQRRLEAIEAEKRRQEEYQRQLIIRKQKALEGFEKKMKAIDDWKRAFVSSFLLTRYVNQYELSCIDSNMHLLTDPYFDKESLPSFCLPSVKTWVSNHDHANMDRFYECDLPYYPREEQPYMKRGLMRNHSLKQYGTRGFSNPIPEYQPILSDHEPYLVPTILQREAPTIMVLTDDNGSFFTERVVYVPELSKEPVVMKDRMTSMMDQFIMMPHTVSSSVEGGRWISLGGDLYYFGDVKNGVPEGYGEIFSYKPNDNVFVGDRISEGIYHDGKLNGKGVLYSKGNVVYRGIFENNQLVRGVMIKNETSRYVGEFKNNQLHGKGRLVLANGFWMEGSWIEGKPSGVMTIHMFDFDPIEYDFQRPNDYTKVTVSMSDDRIAVRLAYSPIGCDCILCFDGSLFIGQTKDRMLSPVRGDLYLLIGNDYYKSCFNEVYEKNNVENVRILKRFDSGMIQLGLVCKS